MRYAILSTKKLDGSVKEQLDQNGFALIEEEFISINKDLSEAAIKRITRLNHEDVLVFTSANAVESVKEYIDVDASFQVFCISGKTKETVETCFSNTTIIDTAPYGNLLAEKIISAQVEKVIFCCGNIRRDELPLLLNENNIAVEEIIVYQTIQTPKHINDHFDAVLFFSPSAVKNFFAVNQLNADAVCFSIGTTTEVEIKQFTNNTVITADDPTQESLAIQITKYFKNQVQL